MRLALIAALTCSCLVGCDRSEGASTNVPAAYRADIENLCHAEERSGALEQDESTRQMLVASWLANAVQTDEAREFLAGLAAVAPAEKAKRRAAEAKRAGVDPCPIANVWSGS